MYMLSRICVLLIERWWGVKVPFTAPEMPDMRKLKVGIRVRYFRLVMLMVIPKNMVAIPFNFMIFIMLKKSKYSEIIASIMDATLLKGREGTQNS